MVEVQTILVQTLVEPGTVFSFGPLGHSTTIMSNGEGGFIICNKVESSEIIIEMFSVTNSIRHHKI